MVRDLLVHVLGVVSGIRGSVCDERNVGATRSLSGRGVRVAAFYFLRAFSEVFGTTPHAYLTQVRLEQAYNKQDTVNLYPLAEKLMEFVPTVAESASLTTATGAGAIRT